MLRKLATLNVRTICAVNGHAYACGVIFALMHDIVIMRSDYGYVCLPEARSGMALSTFFVRTCTELLPPQSARILMLGTVLKPAEAL